MPLQKKKKKIQIQNETRNVSQNVGRNLPEYYFVNFFLQFKENRTLSNSATVFEKVLISKLII